MKRNPSSHSDSRVIVVIDDEPGVRQLLAIALARHTVHCFEDGREALAWFQSRVVDSVDLVISDYHLPGITGAETLRQCRALAPDARFILMSGAFDLSAGDAADQCSWDGCLRKPFPLEELEGIIEQLLPPAPPTQRGKPSPP